MPERPTHIRVLWLEEDGSATHSLSDSLASFATRNVRVTRVESFAAALAALASAPFDVVVATPGPPPADGLDTLRAFSRHAPHLPILLLAETHDDATALQALQFGAQEFLLKSQASPELLARALRFAIERKSVEKQIQVAGPQFSRIIEDAPFCVAMFDTEMRYLAVSRLWSETFGRGHNLIGESHYHVFPDIPEQWKEFHRRGLAGELLRKDEDRWARDDGSEQWLRWAIHPWRKPEGEIGGIVITVEDITPRVLAERNLRFHENLLEETGHLAKVGGWEFEIATGRGFWTREVGVIHELDPGVQPSRDFALTFYSPESRPIIEAALREAVLYGTPYDLELQLITAKGNRRWVRTIAHPVSENGAITRLRGSFQDITERRAADEILRRQASLLDQSYDAVIVWERDHHIVFWNRGAELLYGFSKSEALGCNPQELLHSSVPGEDFSTVLDCLAGAGRWEGELEQLSRSGKPIVVESRMVQVTEGRTFILETNRDVSDKRLLEDQLRQSQKMEAVGRLAGGIAHDFNNLLGVIIGCAELLAETHDPEQVRRRVEDIQKAAGRAANLTRQLLSFSRKQLLKPQVVDARAKLVEMSDMFSRLVGDDVEIRYALPAQLGNVRIDPTQLEQIVLNLVVNAREAMPRGGKILIEAENVEFDEEVVRSHLSLTPGPYVMISVSDTGVGMDAETCKHIFEPFFTTKQGGTGLGLATVYGAVKQSGGTIWVYSEPGCGTTFKVYFPRVDEDSAPPAVPRRSSSLLGSETILLVEDSDALREVTIEFLQASGYTVLETGDPAEALRIAADHVKPIHLLVTDVIMPGLNGRELATKLQPLHPETRVLYMSGYAGNALVNRGALEESITLLSKPFTRSLLLEKVRELLAPVA
ncbi:MAG TPA: PAS domain S-box protein [Candidatus Eisenbacteria bacterium]|nr:PAS domain S-box protein [Candidatus Eisenbacteria bacterium]